MLLESGGAGRGLSITLGGPDGEVRLRAADNGAGKAIVTTASLLGTDVTSDFSQLEAVLDEDTANNTQTARIYINGVLASESGVVIGGGNVNWDGPGDAGIGLIAGVSGGINGPGTKPLGSAAFQGDIARFAVLNTALTADEVARRYAAAVVPEPAGLGVLVLAGAAGLTRRRRRVRA